MDLVNFPSSHAIHWPFFKRLPQDRNAMQRHGEDHQGNPVTEIRPTTEIQLRSISSKFGCSERSLNCERFIGYQGLSPHKKSISRSPSAASFPTETGWHGQRRDSIAPEPRHAAQPAVVPPSAPPRGDAVHVPRIQHATDR